jgi:hypothetical protein
MLMVLLMVMVMSGGDVTVSHQILLSLFQPVILYLTRGGYTPHPVEALGIKNATAWCIPHMGISYGVGLIRTMVIPPTKTLTTALMAVTRQHDAKRS